MHSSATASTYRERHPRKGSLVPAVSWNAAKGQSTGSTLLDTGMRIMSEKNGIKPSIANLIDFISLAQPMVSNMPIEYFERKKCFAFRKVPSGLKTIGAATFLLV
jgi:hypothetical protein